MVFRIGSSPGVADWFKYRSMIVSFAKKISLRCLIMEGILCDVKYQPLSYAVDVSQHCSRDVGSGHWHDASSSIM